VVKNLAPIESTKDSRINLRNFWPSNPNDYLRNVDLDVSKSFLVDLMQLVIGEQDLNVTITSVNEKKKNGISRVGQVIMAKSSRILSPSKRYNISVEYGHKLAPGPIEDCINIWYSGENKRPPLDENWDSFLSYDVETFGGRNIYLPLWVTRLAPTVLGAVERMKELKESRGITDSREKGFCAVISNPEPIRMEFIRLLRKKVDVDIFGRIGKRIENKDETLADYNFNICFENDEYPGYVTEKPFEAWLSGCIPIWRGIDRQNYLNSNAIVNVSNSGFEGAINQILDLLNKENEITNMRSQPILDRTFDLNEMITKLQSQIFHTSASK